MVTPRRKTRRTKTITKRVVMIPRSGRSCVGRPAWFRSLSIRVVSIPALVQNAAPKNAARIPGTHAPWGIFRIRVLADLVPGRLERKNCLPGIGTVSGAAITAPFAHLIIPPTYSQPGTTTAGIYRLKTIHDSRPTVHGPRLSTPRSSQPCETKAPIPSLLLQRISPFRRTIVL